MGIRTECLFSLLLLSKIKIDGLVKSQEFASTFIPVKAGIQSFQALLDPGACPEPDPGPAPDLIRDSP